MTCYDESITAIKGVGPKKAEVLAKLGIETVGDMLGFLPRAYEDRRNIKRICELSDGETAVTKALITGISAGYGYGKNKTLRVKCDDGTGVMTAVFFKAGYLANAFKSGCEYCFYGKVSKNRGAVQMIHPEFSLAEKAQAHDILPVYPLTSGISQSEMRKIAEALIPLAEAAPEFLPDDLIKRRNICSYAYALSNIHFPEDERKFKAARYRLVFDEMLTLQTGLLAMRAGRMSEKKNVRFNEAEDASEYIGSMAFPLTGAQKRAVSEIFADMNSAKQMNRLVQGDVGSGKTAVAEIAMFKAVKSGCQAVMMAPTEILAKQHFDGISERFGKFGITTAFLSGRSTAKEREDIISRLESGKIDVLIGTHALIQPDVKFKRLGLVITDEQHRFGVNQRSLLGEKGENPDMLVMTATPIPRTLAVILYGDLDISVIDELPPGRQKIITKAVGESGRKDVYEFVRREISAGRQCYVVAPLIEDSESISVRSAESLAEELSKKFGEFKVELLHGDMKQAEKDAVMADFAAGKTDVLVSTVVIEVGINVPNATVMVIENAERFGLAQMHQLRGRVGRGSAQSYCILVSDGKTDIAKERADIMTSTSDGFVIAEKDLELRGPGEFFGTRQHGLPDLNTADLVRHMDMLETVREEATVILDEDEYLESEKYAGLRARILKMFGGKPVLKM